MQVFSCFQQYHPVLFRATDFRITLSHFLPSLSERSLGDWTKNEHSCRARKKKEEKYKFVSTKLGAVQLTALFIKPSFKGIFYVRCYTREKTKDVHKICARS